MQYRWKRNIIFFLASQAVSLFGSALVMYAITWHITLTLQSGTYTMLSVVFATVPTLLLSPFAGVWADRYNRKLLIILADSFIAIATLVLAILFISGHESIWMLLVVSAVRGFGSAVQTPAINAMIPDMVPPEHLTRINGINGSVQSAITFAAPFLAGLLFAIAPLSATFFIDVVTAALAVVIVALLVKLPKNGAEHKTATAGTSNYLDDMKKGLAYIRRSDFLRASFIFMIFMALFVGPIATMSPIQVARNYGAEEWRMPAMEIAWSAGMLAGGFIISAWGGFRNKFRTILVANFAMAVGTVVLGIPLPFWLYLSVMGTMGIMLPMMNTASMTMIQMRVEPEYMGRVFSVASMVNSAFFPLSTVIFGPLGDVINLNYIMLMTGGAQIVFLMFFMRNKAMTAAGEPLPQESQTA